MDPMIASDRMRHGLTLSEREEGAEALVGWADKGGYGSWHGAAEDLRDARGLLRARAARLRRNAQARSRRAILRDVADSLGCSLVRGSVSGRYYLE